MAEQTQNDRGEWVPAIPLPLYGVRKECTCGRKFWTMGGYRGHYALVHILHLSGPDRVLKAPMYDEPPGADG